MEQAWKWCPSHLLMFHLSEVSDGIHLTAREGGKCTSSLREKEERHLVKS